jgi:hypothetical protein
MHKTTGNVERKSYLEFFGTNGRKIIAKKFREVGSWAVGWTELWAGLSCGLD